MYNLILSLQQPSEAGSMVLSSLQMRTLELRGIKLSMFTWLVVVEPGFEPRQLDSKVRMWTTISAYLHVR